MVNTFWKPGDDDAARKRVFVPGYSGVISRMQETMAGTFAHVSRDSHFLVYKGCKPTMEAATLPSPDCFYQRKPNPRIKTNAANRSNFHLGDERDWYFETLNEHSFKVPTKIPPRHSSIIPGGRDCSKEQLDHAYVASLTKIGVAGVKRLELAIRMKIDQRTSGGPMALRKAFKYFDADASGDIDPDEFFSAMHAFGLEFTEDQVMALFGYYDVDRDGALSYYEFIDKVLGSGFAFGDGGKKEPEYAVLQPMPGAKNEEAAVMRTTISKELLEEDACKKVFDRYDINKSGEIDLRELSQLVRSLGLSMDREAINNAMFDLDLNQNGTISFDEFWTWWQRKAARGGKSQPAPLAKRKVTASGEAIPRGEDDVPVASSQRSASGAGLRALHERVSQDMDRAKSKSRTGHWEAGGRPSSSLSNLGRPLSRNSMQSTISMDFQHPPLVGRAPKVHNLRSLRRPHTAPVPGDMTPYSRTPDVPGVPSGQTTGFRL